MFEPLTKPTAAALNEIGAAQVALNVGYEGGSSATLIQVGAAEDDRFEIWHQFRWLLYSSTGQIEDVTGVNDPVPLPDEDLFDLDSVEWLAVGMFYRVTGCELAYEHRDPPG